MARFPRVTVSWDSGIPAAEQRSDEKIICAAKGGGMEIIMKIILASASPRRRELLEQIGLEFEIKVSDVEENSSATTPWQMVEELSSKKARAVLESLEQNGEDVLVIGADTVVAVGNSILGKPKDEKEASYMLTRLSGGVHQVYTGVTLLYRPAFSQSGTDVQEKIFHEATKVHFFVMAEEEISFYVATGEPLDKAGAYGIQGLFARYVKGIEGDYSNVVGLPVGRLYQEAKEWLDKFGRRISC